MKTVGRKVLVSVVAGILVSMLSVNVFAADKTVSDNAGEISEINLKIVKVDEPFDSSDDLQRIGEVRYTKALQLGSRQYHLYPTFVNRDEAIRNITGFCAELFNDMSKRYLLGAFKAATIAKYLDVNEKYSPGKYGSGETQEELEKQSAVFSAFGDIYENYKLNEETEEMVSKIMTLAKSDDANKHELIGYLEVLPDMLPYDEIEDGEIEKAVNKYILNVMLNDNVGSIKVVSYIEEMQNIVIRTVLQG